MAAINVPVQPEDRKTSGRWVHRRTCILAGGLATVGGTLALLVHPWFAAVGGVWLIVLRVAQRRHRDDGREPAAVLPDVRQLVDVLDPPRGLERQGLEARRNRGSEFDAERFGARSPPADRKCRPG